MRLTVVGCSGSYPGPESASSCYLLEADHEGRTWRILLDLGSGALGPLHRHAAPFSIDAVFLSHLHADHCLDLCGYHVLIKYHPDGPGPRVPVWGPVGTADRLAAAYGLPADPGMSDEFDFREYDGPVTVGPFVVDPVPVTHPVPAFGLRVRADGRTLGYTGDTGPCDGVDSLAEGADLFLAEASFRVGDTNPPGLHLTGADAAQAAARGGAVQLVLTHVPPWHDPASPFAEAEPHFTGPIHLATAGARFEV